MALESPYPAANAAGVATATLPRSRSGTESAAFLSDRTTPANPKPKRAVLSTMNAKWYQSVTESTRIQAISRSSVAAEMSRIPGKTARLAGGDSRFIPRIIPYSIPEHNTPDEREHSEPEGHPYFSGGEVTPKSPARAGGLWPEG
jgi:hypothetical protein